MATMTAPTSENALHIPWPELIAGITLEAQDLAVTRGFYTLILGDGSGAWSESSGHLSFAHGSQRIDWVRRARPRHLAEFGRHFGLRVPRERMPQIVEALSSGGYATHSWREDHPAEREPTIYAEDPSGGLVQLVSSDDPTASMIDHITLPVEDLEAAENFYRKALGGVVDHYHGWRMEDVHEARAWAAGNDPCAPWTRVSKYSRVNGRTNTAPTPQVYLAFGPTRLGLVVATKHFQEPPEGAVQGTPNLAIRVRATVSAVATHLSQVDITRASTVLKTPGVPFKQVGQRLFLRDPSGHFVVLECQP
jgi:catechol 2,3-dioxygenase-like lactoylglutathione lyase family enzyme